MNRTKKSMKTVVFFFISILIVVGILTSCSENIQDTELHLSEAKLAEEGYYAYIIPSILEKELGLRRDIYIYSLDMQCSKSSASTQGSPMVISYKDNKGNNKLSVQIAPYSVLLIPIEERLSANIHSQWTLTQSINYYENDDGYIVASFVDIFGMYITVTISKDYIARIDIEKLINSLLYIGPPIETINNPWLDICK